MCSGCDPDDISLQKKGKKYMSSIYHRTSIRKYEDREVEKDKITEIIRAGMQAPSAGDQQPWEFYVVTDTEKIKELSGSSPYAGSAAGAKVVIVPVYRTKGLMFPDFAQIDMSIAQENMWLRADELGLGGVWLGIAPLQERMDNVRRILELPDDVEAFSLFPVGYPAEEKTQEDRYDEKRIHYID
jgi:nitroreductase